MWFVFRAKPEKRTTFPLFCERSEREKHRKNERLFMTNYLFIQIC
ncbi:MAG: hypothetical protein U5L45_06390 [Saprospiraceae bacterium]|nr:hypothetical protein [Saprospiraceae bacterium]